MGSYHTYSSLEKLQLTCLWAELQSWAEHSDVDDIDYNNIGTLI